MITFGEWCWGTSFYHNGSHYGFLFFRCPTSFYNRPFINRYAKEAMNYSVEEVAYLYDLFVSFLKACDELPRELFTTKNGELNAALFDSVFTVVASECFKNKTLITQKLHQERIGALKNDPEFEDAITHSTSHTKMVNKRIEKARAYLQ